MLMSISDKRGFACPVHVSVFVSAVCITDHTKISTTKIRIEIIIPVIRPMNVLMSTVDQLDDEGAVSNDMGGA
jgi:acetolactate synthase regulatory subunit